jgi:uncharacterized repeat protein (TIGR01451 family)
MGSNNISVINATTKTVTNSVNVGTNPIGVSVSPDGTEVYVTNNGSNNVSVINTTTNTVTNSVNVGNNPIAFGLFIGPGNPALNITKVANQTTYIAAGQQITYTYNVTNTGNMPTTGPINVTDNQINDGIPFEISATGLSLGQSVPGTATYITTQQDINNGSVTNLANATGSVFDSIFLWLPVTSNNTTLTVPAVQQGLPALTIVKSAYPTSYYDVGQIITYTYTVKNTGNVNILEPITVHDNKILGGQITIGTSGGVLAVGQSITGTATYTITQADMDTGSVTNFANATGSYNNKPVLSNNTNITISAIQNPSLKIEKEVDPKTYFAVGDLIDYSYTVTNKGNVDIAGPITVTDSMFGSKQISSSGLAPGQSVTRGKSYLITPQDIDTGIVINSAFATGSFNDKTVTSNSDKARAKFFGPTTNLFFS